MALELLHVPWRQWMGTIAMDKSHPVVCAVTLVTLAVLGCSGPATPSNGGDEDEIRLPPSSKTAKADSGTLDGASGSPSEPPSTDVDAAAPAGTLCDVSTAAGGPTGGPYPAAPLPGCGNPAPFDPTDIETQIGSYSGPGSPRGACSPADIAQLSANLKNPNSTTWADYRQGLGPACDACVFTKTNETRWGAVVLIAADPTKGFTNFGACHAVVNESAECGRAYQYDQFCLTQTCGGCQGATKTTCVNAAWGAGGACNPTHNAVVAKCSKLAGSNKLCGTTLAEHAKIVCGGC